MKQIIPLLLAGTIGCAGVQTTSFEGNIKIQGESVVEEKPKVEKKLFEEHKNELPPETKQDERTLMEITQELFEATPPYQPGTSQPYISLGEGYQYQYIRNPDIPNIKPSLGYSVVIQSEGVRVIFIDVDAPEKKFSDRKSR